jgi:dihydroorotase
MLGLTDEGVMSVEEVVEKMCHAPARLFEVNKRGFLRVGYKADIALVRREDWTLTPEDIVSKCGWSPLEGSEMHWKVERTMVNGTTVYDRGRINDDVRGEALRFR